MNYRLLFIIAFLILGLGVAGLFFMDSSSEPGTQTVIQEKLVEYDNVPLTIAVAQREIAKGDVIREGDYRLIKKTIRVEKDKNNSQDTPEIGLDVTDFIRSNNGSFDLAIATKDIRPDENLLPSNVIMPGSNRYTSYQLKQNGLFSYNIPVKEENAGLLSSLEVGDEVSLYVLSERHSNNYGNNQATNGIGRLDKIVKNAKVLNIIKTSNSNVLNQSTSRENSDVVAVISVSVNGADLKRLYEISSQLKVIPLPKFDNTETAGSGVFIRNLIGEMR